MQQQHCCTDTMASDKVTILQNVAYFDTVWIAAIGYSNLITVTLARVCDMQMQDYCYDTANN